MKSHSWETVKEQKLEHSALTSDAALLPEREKWIWIYLMTLMNISDGLDDLPSLFLKNKSYFVCSKQNNAPTICSRPSRGTCELSKGT